MPAAGPTKPRGAEASKTPPGAEGVLSGRAPRLKGPRDARRWAGRILKATAEGGLDLTRARVLFYGINVAISCMREERERALPPGQADGAVSITIQKATMPGGCAECAAREAEDDTP